MRTYIAPTAPTHRTSTAVPTGFRRRLATVTDFLQAWEGLTTFFHTAAVLAYRPVWPISQSNR